MAEDNPGRRMVLTYAKSTGVLALLAFIAIAVTGPFRGAPVGIVVASAVGAVLMAAFSWFKFFRPEGPGK